MKKRQILRWFISLMIMTWSIAGYAQTKPYYFGIRGGLNMANINQDLEDQTIFIEGVPFELDFTKNNYNTYSIGGFFQYNINPMFAIQLNALYNMKGTTVETELSTTFQDTIDINGTVEQEIKLAYLSFPLLGILSFGNPAGIRPYLLAGPELSILLSAEAKTKAVVTARISGYSQTFRDTEKDDIKDECESLEWAFNLGGGVEFPLSTMKAFIDARYGLGMSTVNKEGDEDLKNNVIYLNVGLRF
jgi:hypothetical protein